MSKKIVWRPIDSESDKVIMTPLGPLDTTKIDNDAYHFEFWTAHTNFPITLEHKNKLDNLVGIESLNIISPLRMIISIGRLFSMKELRLKIEAILKDEENKYLTELREKMKAYKDWAIYIFPNEKIDFTTCNDKDFKEKLDIFEDAKKNIGGQLIRP